MIRTVNAMYGAFELKRYYQRNMLMGTFSAFLLAVMLIGLVWVYGRSLPEGKGTTVGPGGGGQGTKEIVWRKRPSPGPPRPGQGIKPPLPKQSGRGEIVMIDDLMAEEDTSYLGLDDLPESGFYDPFETTGSGDGFPGGDGISGYPPGYLPPVDTFIACEVQPKFVHDEIPVYPRIAREGGFTADVLVQAFIGTDGRVIMAQAARCSRPDIGFEEAAVEAAYKCTYRPAIQNGEAVAVWIDYTVKFVLDEKLR